MQLPSDQGKCLHVAECSLRVADWNWPLSEQHATEIELHWQRRQAEMPTLFNGAVYLFKDYTADGHRLTGDLFKTDFKTLLYWRSLPLADRGSVREASGSSLIRSAEGHLIYGRQSPGHLNSGRIYPPSGVIDADDVDGDVIDIDASIRRELCEETGLTPADFVRLPGYRIALVGTHVTIGIEWKSKVSAADLRVRIQDFLRSQAAPELDDIVIVEPGAFYADDVMPEHARTFMRALLGAQ